MKNFENMMTCDESKKKWQNNEQLYNIYENHDEIWWKFVQNIHQIMKKNENRDELWWKGLFHYFSHVYVLNKTEPWWNKKLEKTKIICRNRCSSKNLFAAPLLKEHQNHKDYN